VVATPFICYAKEDRQTAERLHNDLTSLGASPWLDVINLIGGERWETSIRRAVRECSHFIALLSTNSVSKKGYVQKELKEALDVVDKYPPDKVFIVPVRLDECTPTHEKLMKFHWVDVFPDYSLGLKRLAVSLSLDATALPIRKSSPQGPRKRHPKVATYPRVFVSCSTAWDRSKVQLLLTALLDNEFDPVLGSSVVDRQLERNAAVVTDISVPIFNSIPSCVAFISLQTKRDDYKVSEKGRTRYFLPPWTVAEEVFAWKSNIGLLLRIRDIAVEEPPYNRHIRTCAFMSDDDFPQAVNNIVNDLNEFRISVRYSSVLRATQRSRK
jgi:hypothetical protein